MARQKIAVIGNSGSGKSAIVRRLGGDLDSADMDKHFSCTEVPPYEKVLSWMLERTGGQVVLAVSVHMEMLELMTQAKRAGRNADCFDHILFVYLHQPDVEKHRTILNMRDAWGKPRGPKHIEGVVGNRLRVHNACKDIADVTLNAATMLIEELVGVIAGLRESIEQRQTG
jgi:hypothetical protein